MSAALLALDLGTTTGFAARVDGRVVSGVASFRPGRFEGGEMRYLRFRRWLTELYSSLGGIEEIAFEEVRRHLGVDAAHAYGGFMATLTAWAEHHDVPYQGVPVGTIKRYIAGKGNAPKSEIIAAVRARDFEPADDNEAVAIAILLWTEDNGGALR